MKKKNIILLAILCSIIVVGCVILISYYTHKQNTNKLQETASGLLQEDDESQPYWNSPQHMFAKGVGGYYFVNEVSSMLMFFDSKDEMMYPVCGKPDCNHEDESCNAFINRRSYRMNVYFYQDAVYLIRTDENGNTVLVQEALDGSYRKDLFEIGTADAIQTIYLAFSDDSVYIVNMRDNAFLRKDDGITKMRKRTLDGKEDKIVASFSGADLQIDELKIYNQQVYFTVKSYSSDIEAKKNSVMGKGFYTYNPKDESVVQLTDGDVWDYTIDSVNKILYLYIKGEALYKCDLTNIKDTKEILYESSDENLFCNISYDGKYLYLDNSISANLTSSGPGDRNQKKILILDTKGTTINSIPVASTIVFGDQNYIFIGLGGATVSSSGKGKINWKSTNWGYIKKDDLMQAQTISEIKSE